MARRIEVSRGLISGFWTWHCWDCGWVGISCPSEGFARAEAERHVCPEERT